MQKILTVRHSLALMLALILGCLLGVSFSSVAHSYTFSGCRYDQGSISPITYRFYSVSSASLLRATKHGVSSWNNTSAPGYFSESTTSLDPEVNVTDDSYPNQNAYAWISATCDADGTYSGNEVNFVWNSSLIHTRTGPQKDRISTHELGHAYGLGHVTYGCRIMRVDIGYLTDCSMTTPQPNDINGVIARY